MAEFQVVSKMTELKERAARLNAATDEINALLAGVEQQIVDTKIGIEVWLPNALSASDETGSTGGETQQVIERLGYAKVGGSWCLATKKVSVVSGYFEGDPSCPYTNEYVSSEPEPLKRSSRDTRIKALELLPALLDRLAERADESLRVIESAKEVLG
jgi:hypothetical protein